MTTNTRPRLIKPDNIGDKAYSQLRETLKKEVAEFPSLQDTIQSDEQFERMYDIMAKIFTNASEAAFARPEFFTMPETTVRLLRRDTFCAVFSSSKVLSQRSIAAPE